MRCPTVRVPAFGARESRDSEHQSAGAQSHAVSCPWMAGCAGFGRARFRRRSTRFGRGVVGAGSGRARFRRRSTRFGRGVVGACSGRAPFRRRSTRFGRGVVGACSGRARFRRRSRRGELVRGHRLVRGGCCPSLGLIFQPVRTGRDWSGGVFMCRMKLCLMRRSRGDGLDAVPRADRVLSSFRRFAVTALGEPPAVATTAGDDWSRIVSTAGHLSSASPRSSVLYSCIVPRANASPARHDRPSRMRCFSRLPRPSRGSW